MAKEKSGLVLNILSAEKAPRKRECVGSAHRQSLDYAFLFLFSLFFFKYLFIARTARKASLAARQMPRVLRRHRRRQF